MSGEWVDAYWSIGQEAVPDASVKICFSGMATLAESVKYGNAQSENCEMTDGWYNCPGADCVKNLGKNGARVWLNVGGGGGFQIKESEVLGTDVSKEGYHGLSLDVESLKDTSTKDILDSLAAAKKQGLTTHVTVSHTGYGLTADAVTAILKSPDLDVVSAQMYTCGKYIQDTASPGISWAQWKAALGENPNVKVYAGVPSYDYPSYVNAECLNKWCAQNLGKPCDGTITWRTAKPCNADPRDWDMC